MEDRSVPAAAEAIAPGLPVEDMLPAILRDRIRLDHILRARVRLAAALRIHRVEADGRPVQAPAVQVVALAHRVQAAQAAAHAANRSECERFLQKLARREFVKCGGVHSQKNQARVANHLAAVPGNVSGRRVFDQFCFLRAERMERCEHRHRRPQAAHGNLFVAASVV